MTDFLTQNFKWILALLSIAVFMGASGIGWKKDSLLWRFWTIIAVALLAGVTALVIPPKLGIDLAGGTSLLYELDLHKIPTDNHEQLSDLTTRVIEVLRKRVDPQGLKNIMWRVVGGKRIQIQMPQADAATREAQAAEKTAREALETSSLKLSSIMAAINKPPAEREKAIQNILGSATQDSEQHRLVDTLLKANDVLAAVNAQAAKYPAASVPDSIRNRKYDAENAFDAAVNAIRQSNIDLAKFDAMLSAADNPEDVDAQQNLAELPAKYPRQKDKIERVIAAHKKVIELSGGGVDDPAELQYLVTRAGVLDFRIAVESKDISPDELRAAVQSLDKYGPERQVTAAGIRARWFEISTEGLENFYKVSVDPATGRRTYDPDSGNVLAPWASHKYLLCYDDLAHTLTHAEPRKPWTVTANSPYTDPASGGLVLPFRLDNVGAVYMGQLTSYNRTHPMAILLDDKAMTAPVIQSQITSSGQITFGSGSATRSNASIKKEADQLKQIMDAGSLPATLQHEPISVQQITPDMGKDNIARGTHSAYFAVLAVVVFMFAYYTITGVFADLALMLNLVLVLAAMALFRGTFTLPGIAGLVLTLGMAVDANVLINERIREEIHKGASLWMAIKQGYDKVFWTIFDANLTTSLTSIVLIYVGSEEVKGFGVTLLIGLMIHMFTALFVTRTFMMAAVRWGILRAIDDHSIGEYLKEIFTFTWLRNGHFPFMRVITVSNIDWIGKRHIFWAISAVITVAGLIAFVARGQDKYDIEFRGGTQVTFKLSPTNDAKDPAKQTFLTLDQVRKRIEELSLTPALKDLQSARVYGVGPDTEHQFEMQTTINNPQDDPGYVKRVLLTPLAEKFSDVMKVKPAINFAHSKSTDVSELIDDGIIRPITAPTLDQVFAKTSFKGLPNRDVTSFDKGTAILLDNIDPPQTAQTLTTRIQNARQSTEISSDTPYRAFSIIPVTAVTDTGTEPAEEGDKRPLTRAVMVSVDPSILYDEGAEMSWQTRVAASEWKVLNAAARAPALPFDGVTTFDAVVASQAKIQALLAIVLSLILIVAYVWLRFGGIWYGIGAILSLAHDAIVALAATVLSGLAYGFFFHSHPNWLLLSDFKINLTMIAAYLTIIGYSVNDTIVIFDRVRELRGRSSAPLSPKLINDAINQCFGRTIWTTFTVFIVVLIMYVWGGEGVHGFSFAMLIGVITGAYSTLAIASPMLLTTARASDRGGHGARKTNPFLRTDASQDAPALPQLRVPPQLPPKSPPTLPPSPATDGA